MKYLPRFYKRSAFLLALVAFLMQPFSVYANDPGGRWVHVFTGTGFFVTPSYIITNAHVVPDCHTIWVRGAIRPTQVTLVAADTKKDLALLASKEQSPRYAYLRANTGLAPGDKVTVIGYPLERGLSGQYLMNSATVENINKTINNTATIEFTESVERGNSGGPLLDRAGNVIGVVVGKMQYYQSGSNPDKQKPYKTSGIAIELPVLKQFLMEHSIFTSSQSTYDVFDERHPEERAEKYLVNVLCVDG